MRSRKPPTDAEGEADLLQVPLLSGGVLRTSSPRPSSLGSLRPAEVCSDRSESPSEHSCAPTTPSAEPASREASNRVIGNGRGGCRSLRPGVDLDMQASGTGSRGPGQDPIRSGAAPAPVEGGSVLAAHSRSGAEGLPASQTAEVRECHAPSATRRPSGAAGAERETAGAPRGQPDGRV